MGAKSGSGAATSSGVNYQNRVAAYLLATAICTTPLPIFENHEMEALGFETTEKIDDLNITLRSGDRMYLQAKRKLSFSLTPSSEMYSVLTQFAAQYLQSAADQLRFVLVTSSDSSKRVTGDMKAALDALRSGPEDIFRRDQPTEVVKLVDKLKESLSTLLGKSTLTDKQAAALEVLRRSYVMVIDIAENSPLEQAIILLLQSRSFINPPLFWSKIVTDCLSHSSSRRTLSIEHARSTYSQFLLPEDPRKILDRTPEFLKFELGGFNFPVGRELVLGTLENEKDDNVYVFEMYRFDDECRERMRFESGKCFLRGGLVMTVIQRTATYQGMERILKAKLDLLENRKVFIVPINSNEDFEQGLCADRHRTRLRNAFLENAQPTKCLHCGKPISTSDAGVIEMTTDSKLHAGLVHNDCIKPEDRLLGTVRSAFFERYDYLRNFDVNAWFEAIPSGQGVFAGISTIKATNIVWSGRESKIPPGDYIVELILDSGESEFAFRRGCIDRFSKSKAEHYADFMKQEAKVWKERGDPKCISDETRTFGLRSFLLKRLGTTENIREIVDARAVPFQQSIANRYSVWKNWYAPVAFLRKLLDGEPFIIRGFAPLITNPLLLDRFLENWKKGKLEIPEYEVIILADDDQFDDFVSEMQGQGLGAIVDPLVDPTGRPNFVSGVPIQSLDDLKRQSADHGK